MTQETVGSFLRSEREHRRMSLAEVSRVTRIPTASLASIESDRFDELPGEVFVRGFLKAYAQAVGVLPAEALARYTANGRAAFVAPMPLSTPIQSAQGGRSGQQGRRFGVAIAFVLLLILFTLALSIVLKPRGRDLPPELSQVTAASTALVA